MTNETAIITLKPKFLFWPSFFARIPITIFITIWSTGFFGIFGMFGLMGLKSVIGFEILPHWFSFVFAGFTALVLSQFYSLYMDEKNYEKTRYLFYEDELVYYDSYWVIQEKCISYKNIIEVSLTKGIIQQQNNLGTIKLNTAAGCESSTSGILIKDIENPDKIYKTIKKLINDNKNSFNKG
ncbi:MAG: PH domain-containing protein [bacterium]